MLRWLHRLRIRKIQATCSMYNSQIASKLYSYFIERLDVVENSKGWLIGDCPHCGKKKKWGVHLETNRSNCFVCGVKSKPLQLVKDIEEFKTIHEVYKLLLKYEGFNFQISTNNNYEAPKPIKSTLPEDFKLVGIYDTKIDQMARNYLKKRGFSTKRAMMHGLGYSS